MSVWCVLTVLNLPIKPFHYGTLFFWRLSCHRLLILSAQLLRTCDCLFFSSHEETQFLSLQHVWLSPCVLTAGKLTYRSKVITSCEKKRHESFGSTPAESCLVPEWRGQRLKQACSMLSSDGPEGDASSSDWKTKTLHLLRHRRHTCLPVSFSSDKKQCIYPTKLCC